MQVPTRRVFLRSLVGLGVGALAAACSPQASPVNEPVAVNTLVVQPTRVATLVPTAVEQATLAATVQPTAEATLGQPTSIAKNDPTVAPPTSEPAPVVPDLAVVRGGTPQEITERALAALGGIERFVRNGYDVIIKPNICNANNGPEYASTTNPDVVATLVRLCLGAGAKRVRVMDSPFAGTPAAAYVRSGIQEAVEAAGGVMEVMAAMRYVATEIPQGVDLKSWSIYEPILAADLVINVPIAKDHGLARLTLGGKNLMGVILDRNKMHRNLGQRIADVVSVVRPQLTVIDAVRALMDHGPTGGNLGDVQRMDTVIASADIVAADAYATSLFGLQPSDIDYITAAHEMGIGTMDPDQIKLQEINL